MTTSTFDVPQDHLKTREPVLFEEFFDLGLDESVSPFLTPSSRKWSDHLTLKTSIVAAILLIAAFGLSFFPLTVPLSKLILILIYVLVGIPPLIESLENILQLEINIDVLMTLAAFSSVILGSEIEGALLLVLFSISHAMEDAVAGKAKSAISSLTKLSPTTAFVFDDVGKLVEKSVRDIQPGVKILIKSGAIIPLDGKVVSGNSSLNLVHLTGESLPIRKIPGDLVPSGARNLEGALVVEVLHTNAESTLTKIIKLVVEAQSSRPKVQLWFDKLSGSYAMSIILFATLSAIFYPYFFDIPYFSSDGSIYRALSFLIAASPCALIIAIPIAYLSAISVCAKNGIILKGGITLDALASCKAFAFDKTGTLTFGTLQCVSLEAFNTSTKISSDQALSVAYALERNAIHPTAAAIVTYAETRNIPIGEIHNFKAIPGFGLEGIAVIDHQEIFCAIGHFDFIKKLLTLEQRKPLEDRIEEIQNSGAIVSVLLIGQDIFVLHFQDHPRPQISQVLARLQNQRGMRLIMLTGDHEESAQKIAKKLNISEVYANLRPEDKLAYVTKFSQKEGLAMVGDGINDAPALARATVGISMGKLGNSAAVEASDIILLQDNIEQLDWLVKKAHQTKKIVRENLTIASMAILLASLPALAGFVPLWLAVILHEGGTVIVGLNALRLLKK